MIAVYYNLEARPHTMFVLDVKDREDFLPAIERELYPRPTGDVILIENGEIIDQFFPEE